MPLNMTLKKRLELSVICGLIFSLLLSLSSFEANCNNVKNNVLRLHILANSNSSLYDNSSFTTLPTGGGTKYLTLGAGPDFLSLQSDENRLKDEKMYIKRDMINTGVVDCDKIDKLIVAEKNFRNNGFILYTWFPSKWGVGYNSNSFTKGLLNSADIVLPREPIHSVPGWKKPLPDSYYE